MTDFEFYLKRSTFLVEITTAVVASITYKSYKKTPNALFLYFVWFVVLVETLQLISIINWRFPNLALMVRLREILPESFFKSNIWLGSIYSIVSFFIFLTYYVLLTKDKHLLRFQKLLLLIYSISVLVTLLHYTSLFSSFLNIHMYTGVFGTLIASFIYLQDILKGDSLETFHKTLPFWITIGLIFFNLVTMPIFIFAKHFNFSQSVYTYILVVSCFVMYGSFIIGFITHNKVHKPSYKTNGI